MAKKTGENPVVAGLKNAIDERERAEAGDGVKDTSDEKDAVKAALAVASAPLRKAVAAHVVGAISEEVEILGDSEQMDEIDELIALLEQTAPEETKDIIATAKKVRQAVEFLGILIKQSAGEMKRWKKPYPKKRGVEGTLPDQLAGQIMYNAFTSGVGDLYRDLLKDVEDAQGK